MYIITSTFLKGIVAPDILVGDRFGVEAHLENWRALALCFEDANLEVTTMEMPTSSTLVASTVTRVTISSNTLCQAFPHLNSDGHGGTNGGVWSPLAVRMLDQKLVLRGLVHFGWDNTSHKVVYLHSEADMMTPMLKLLGSLDDVSSVFCGASVTPDTRFTMAWGN